MIWNCGTVVKFQELTRRWAEKRNSYALNEDFIDVYSKEDLDSETLIAETAPENIFTHNPYDSFIIISITENHKDFYTINSAKTLKIRLQQSLRALIGTKFDIELIATNAKTAQKLECRMLTDEEKNMYYSHRVRNAKALIIIRFNMPLTFGKYCDIVSIIDNLKRATLGGF